jgi:hypothetical protein
MLTLNCGLEGMQIVGTGADRRITALSEISGSYDDVANIKF